MKSKNSAMSKKSVMNNKSVITKNSIWNKDWIMPVGRILGVGLALIIAVLCIRPKIAFADEEEYVLGDELTGYGVLLEEQAEDQAESQTEVQSVGAPAENQTAELTYVSSVPSEADAYKAMIALKSQYTEGMTYTNANYYGWKGGIYSGGYGCAGFAFMLSDAAFGSLPARMVYNVTIDDVHVGDILRVNNNQHSVIILEKYSTYVVLAEGNYNSSVHWGRILYASDIAEADYMLTRYPEGTFKEACTITFDINGAVGNVVVQMAEKGQAIVLSNTVPERAGYIFEGWATSSNTSIVEYEPGETYTFAGDITLYAVWKQDAGSVSPNRLKGTQLQIYSDGTLGLVVEFVLESSVRSGFGYYGYIGGKYDSSKIQCFGTTDGVKFIVKLTASQMSDTVNIGIVEYEDPSIKYAEVSQSVKGYVYSAMRLSSTTEKDKELMRTLLNYGAEAQKYFGYNTADLANTWLSEEEKKVVVREDDLSSGFSIEGSCDGINYIGTALILDSTFTLRHYFELTEGDDISSYSLVCDGENVTGKMIDNNLAYIDISIGGIDKYYSSPNLDISKGSGKIHLVYGVKNYTTLAYLEKPADSQINKLACAIADYARAYYNYRN